LPEQYLNLPLAASTQITITAFLTSTKRDGPLLDKPFHNCLTITNLDRRQQAKRCVTLTALPDRTRTLRRLDQPALPQLPYFDET